MHSHVFFDPSSPTLLKLSVCGCGLLCRIVVYKFFGTWFVQALVVGGSGGNSALIEVLLITEPLPYMRCTLGVKRLARVYDRMRRLSLNDQIIGL